MDENRNPAAQIRADMSRDTLNRDKPWNVVSVGLGWLVRKIRGK